MGLKPAGPLQKLHFLLGTVPAQLPGKQRPKPVLTGLTFPTAVNSMMGEAVNLLGVQEVSWKAASPELP